MRASATFSDIADIDSNVTTKLPPESITSGEGSVITSLTLEQTVLAVFRPRPDLPSAVSPNKSQGLGSSKSKSSASDGASNKRDKSVVIEASPEGEGWSISSLLLPLKSASSDAARAEMLRLGGCPVAARSAIHVVGGRVSGGSREPSASDGCVVSDAGCDTGPAGPTAAAAATGSDVLTRLLLPAGSGSESVSESREPTSRSCSISDFLQEKLWVGDAGAAAPAASKDGTAEGEDTVAAATAVSSTTPAVARLDHYLSGRGGTRGVSVANLVNMHPTSGAFADFLQPVPYFMEPLLGTLRARVVPSSLSSSFVDHPAVVGRLEPAAGPLVSLARNVTLTPGEGRRPAVVEARLWVPAASTVVVGFDFFKRFLTVDDFPPDPSRGFDVPPPLARFSFAGGDFEGSMESVQQCEGPGDGDGGDRLRQGGACLPGEGVDGEGGGCRVVYAYGEAGLLDTPQPDFSMPFNVITFTSTVITFFLGTAINLLVRKSRKEKKKKVNKDRKGDVAEAAGEDCDERERSGDRAGGRAYGRHRWFDRPRNALVGVFGRSRGQTDTGQRIRKDVGHLKGD